MELAFGRVLKMISRSALRRDALEGESQLHVTQVRKKNPAAVEVTIARHSLEILKFTCSRCGGCLPRFSHTHRAMRRSCFL